MATISEIRGQIGSQKQQVVEAKQNVQKVKSTIPQTTQRQLRGQQGATGLAGRDFQRSLKSAREKVGAAERELSAYEKELLKKEKQVESYLQTDSGKLQYAKENNLKGKPIYGKLGKGYANEVLAYEYDTPYGKVIDRSPEYKLREMQQKVELSNMGFSNLGEYQEALGYGKVLGGNVLVTDTGRKIALTQAGAETLQKELEGLDLNKYDKTYISRVYGVNVPESAFKRDVAKSFANPEAVNALLGQSVYAFSPNKSPLQVRNEYNKMMSGFNMVSASSDNKDLNITKTTQPYGNITVQGGIFSGEGSGIPSNESSGNWLSRTSSLFTSGFKKGYQKEVYNEDLNIFVKADNSDPTAIAGSSVQFTRTPTLAEYKSFGRIVGGDTSNLNILTVNVQDLAKQTRKYDTAQNELVSLGRGKELLFRDIERLGGKVIKEEGSYRVEKPTDESKVKEYETIVRQIQNVEEREQKQIQNLQKAGGSISKEGVLITPTIQTGLGSFTRQTPITEFSGLGNSFFVPSNIRDKKDLVIRTSKTISEPFNILGFTAGSTLGVGTQLTLESRGLTEVSPQRTIRVPDLFRGQFTEEELARGRVGLTKDKVVGAVTAEKIGLVVSSVTKTGVDIGKYFIPVAGNVVFTSEIAGSFAESDFSAKKFVKEKPLQAAILGGIGAYKIGKYAVGKIKASQYSKYIAKPEAKILDLRTRQIKNTYKESRLRPRVDIRKSEEINRLGLSVRKKGVTKTTEYYPSKDLSGRVYEIRDLGKVRISYVKGKGKLDLGKIKVEKAYKEFSGTARVTESGKYIESISYGKGISKVTNIEKSGKGTVQLFKKGKLLKEVNIKSEPFAELGRLKTKTQKIELDRQFMDTKLKSTLVKGKIQQKVGIKKNIGKGEFNIQVQSSGYTDIVESSPRKGLLQLKSPQRNIVIKAQRGQRIEYGIDKSYDATRGISKGDKLILRKEITPTIQRQIQSGSEAQVILGYVNPKYKIIKSASNIEKLKNKEMINLIKEAGKRQGSKINIPEFRLPNIGGSKVIQQSSSQIVTGAYQYGSPEYYATLTKFGIDTRLMPKLGSTVFVEKPIVSSTTIPQINLPVPQTTRYALVDIGTKPLTITQEKLGYGLSNLGETTEQNKIDTRQLRVIKNDLKLDTGTSIDLNIRTIDTTRLDLDVKQDVKNDFKLDTKLTQDLDTKQKTTQDLTLLETLKENIRQRDKQTEFNLDLSLPRVDTGKSRRQRIIKGFEAFTRKRGQDVSIGEFGTLGEAKIKLAKELTSTLRASGFVTKSGKKLNVQDLGGFGSGFRKSKVDPYRIVQRKERRLSSRPEVSEIQFFRKARGKKPKKRKGGFL